MSAHAETRRLQMSEHAGNSADTAVIPGPKPKRQKRSYIQHLPRGLSGFLCAGP